MGSKEEVASARSVLTVEALRDRAKQVAQELERAAASLKDPGVLPNEALNSSIASLRTEYQAVHEVLERSANELGIPVTVELGSWCISDLEVLARSIEASVAARTAEAQRSSALGILQRIQSIRVLSGDPTTHAGALSEAERLAVEIQNAPSGETPAMVGQLVAGGHPLAALLRLVEHARDLTEGECELCRDSIASAFGANLAIAALLGRLTTTQGSSEPTPPEAVDLAAPPPNAVEVPSRFPVAPADPGEIQLAVETATERDLSELVPDTAAEPAESAVEPPEPVLADIPGAPGETAAELARRALESRYSSQRLRVLEALVWRLVADGRLAAARQLDRMHGQLSEGATASLPDWLLSSVILGQLLRSSTGSCAQELEKLFSGFSTSCFLPGNDEWNEATRVLMAAGTLLPAILAPVTNAPSLLRELEFGPELSELSRFCKVIAGFGDRGHPLDPNSLKDVTAQADWHARLGTLRSEVESWLKQAPTMTMLYAPATKVWQILVKAEGALHQLLAPIRTDGMDRIDAVRHECQRWKNPAFVDQEIQRTFRSLTKTKKAAKIEARALQQLQARVREATKLADRWIVLQESRPGPIRDFLLQQARQLRDEFAERYPLVVSELDRYLERRPTLYRKGAAHCLIETLGFLRQSFEPSSTFDLAEPEPHHALGADLLRFPELRLDQSLQPIIVGEDLTALFLKAIADGDRDWEVAFDARLEARDLEGSDKIIEILSGRNPVDPLLPALRARQEIAGREARAVLQADLDATQAEVETAVASGLVRETERSRLMAEIEEVRAALLSDRVPRFYTSRERLEGVRRVLVASKEEELDRARENMKSLALGPGDPERLRIQSAIDRADVWTANEYIDLIRRNEVLPEEADRRRPFQEFWPHCAREITEALGEQKLKGFRDAIEARSELAGLRFDLLDDSQLRRASEMVKTWTQIANHQNPPTREVRQILESLGFENPRITGNDSRQRRDAWMHVEAETIADRRLAPVSHFGSQARGRYRVFCVRDLPSADDLVRRVGDTAHGAPVIVFHFGVMSPEKRRRLTGLCREQHRTFVVLDDVLTVFLAAEKGIRLPVFFACTLPFTWLEPYTTTAGLVPPEVFFGRQAERESIQSPMGSCFIFGGRQLGKTALLRDVERVFHRPEKGRVAHYVDLKAEGIGYNLPPEDVWRVITLELKRSSVSISSRPEQQSVDRHQRAIRAWLEEDPTRRILFLLDEADTFLARDGERDFRCSAQLKGLMDQTQRRFKVVFAGLHNVQRSVRSSNHPLAHYGEPICVGPLIEKGQWRDARALIELPTETMGYLFASPDLVTRMLSQTNYYPSLIQVYAQALLRLVADPVSGVFDEANSPPSIVSGEAVDRAYRSIHDTIRERVRLTLQLDARYEVLAYALALEFLLGSSKGLPDGHSIAWFRSEALTWWSGGFEGYRGSDEAIRNILDEMVGLGVLREANPGRYTFRNPNVVAVLGTSEEIERELEREREKPLEYVPALFRRPDPVRGTDAPERSPLTVEQEEVLRARKNGASVVFAWELAGVAELKEFLLSRFGSRFFDMVSVDTDLAGFRHRLDALDRREPGGTTLICVEDEEAWSEQWLELALERCKNLRSQDRHVRFLFPAGPHRCWTLLDDAGSTGLIWSGEVDLVTLKPWADEALRQWFEDLALPCTPEDRRLRIPMITGCWPTVLYKLREFVRSGYRDWEETLRAAEHEALQLARRSEVFLSSDPNLIRAREILANLSELGTATSEDLVELTGDDKLVGRTLRWAELLHLVTRTADGAWKVDPVLARALG